MFSSGFGLVIYNTYINIISIKYLFYNTTEHGTSGTVKIPFGILLSEIKCKNILTTIYNGPPISAKPINIQLHLSAGSAPHGVQDPHMLPGGTAHSTTWAKDPFLTPVILLLHSSIAQKPLWSPPLDKTAHSQ